ncbi:MAG: hypothetical protein ACXVCP_17655 [Bdellovibrio sp.]
MKLHRKILKSWLAMALIFMALTAPGKKSWAQDTVNEAQLRNGGSFANSLAIIMYMATIQVVQQKIQEDRLQGKETNPREVVQLVKKSLSEVLSRGDFWSGFLTGEVASNGTKKILETVLGSQASRVLLQNQVFRFITLFGGWEIGSQFWREAAARQEADSDYKEAMHPLSLLSKAFFGESNESQKSVQILVKQFANIIWVGANHDNRSGRLDRVWRTKIATGDFVLNIAALATGNTMGALAGQTRLASLLGVTAGGMMMGSHETYRNPYTKTKSPAGDIPLTADIVMEMIRPTPSDLTDTIRELRAGTTLMRLRNNFEKIEALLERRDFNSFKPDYHGEKDSLRELLSDRKDLRNSFITTYFEKQTLADKRKQMLDREQMLASSGHNEETVKDLQRKKDKVVYSVANIDEEVTKFYEHEKDLLAKVSKIPLVEQRPELQSLIAEEGQQVAQALTAVKEILIRLKALSDEKAQSLSRRYYWNGFDEDHVARDCRELDL